MSQSSLDLFEKKKKQHRSFCPAAEFTTPHQGGLVSRIQ
jgi:hypothetical protein